MGVKIPLFPQLDIVGRTIGPVVGICIGNIFLHRKWDIILKSEGLEDPRKNSFGITVDHIHMRYDEIELEKAVKGHC